jgi:hypothetical protein
MNVTVSPPLYFTVLHKSMGNFIVLLKTELPNCRQGQVVTTRVSLGLPNCRGGFSDNFTVFWGLIPALWHQFGNLSFAVFLRIRRVQVQ